MANERFVVSRNPQSGHFTITREDPKGHIYSTEVANFKQAGTWIWMATKDKTFARRVCERMAENYNESTEDLPFMQQRRNTMSGEEYYKRLEERSREVDWDNLESVMAYNAYVRRMRSQMEFDSEEE